MTLSIVYLIAGFILICFSADWLVDGASSLARKVRVSDLVIGLTIVAFGTSAPELVVNLTASVNNVSDIALTNILGSNIINVMVILGLSATIYPIVCKKSTYMYEIPMYIFATVLILLMMTNVFGLVDINGDRGISRLDGVLLLVCFAGFMYYSVYQGLKSRKTEELPEAGKETSVPQSPAKAVMPVWKSVILIIAGLAGLVVSGRLIVDNAVTIAEDLGVRQSIIGITIVALGTSLPELATSVVAAIKKNSDLAIGNVIGSNIFNIFFIVGISAVVKPLGVYDGFLLDVVMNVLTGVLLMLFMITKRDISRYEGVTLLVIFGVYMYYLLQNA